VGHRSALLGRLTAPRRISGRPSERKGLGSRRHRRGGDRLGRPGPRGGAGLPTRHQVEAGGRHDRAAEVHRYAKPDEGRDLCYIFFFLLFRVTCLFVLSSTTRMLIHRGRIPFLLIVEEGGTNAGLPSRGDHRAFAISVDIPRHPRRLNDAILRGAEVRGSSRAAARSGRQLRHRGAGATRRLVCCSYFAERASTPAL